MSGDEWRYLARVQAVLNIALLAWIVLLLCRCAPQAQPVEDAQCLPYDRPVVLTGVVQRVTSDHEAYFVLVPQRMLCTIADDFDDAEYEVRQLQLVGYTRVVVSNRPVQITGELMHGYTARHHTEVLMGAIP